MPLLVSLICGLESEPFSEDVEPDPAATGCRFFEKMY